MRVIIIPVFLLIITSLCFAQNKSEILNHSETVELIKGKLLTRKKLEILIANYDDRIETFSIPFQEDDRLEINSATVRGIEGRKIANYKNKDFTESSYVDGGTFMSDQKLKNVKLPTRDFPYIFEIDYSQEQSDYIALAQWSPVYYLSMPVKQALLEVIIPEDLKVKVEFDSSVFTHQSSISDNLKTYRWTAQNIPVFQREIFGPPISNMVPKVWVVPEQFHYAFEGSTSTWQDFGVWLSKMNADLETLTPSEQIKIDKLTSGLTSKTDIIRALYYHMQDNTRYVNVSFGIGGLKPYPASYVCENQFGDCKALTIYMKALLKYKGIESYYAPVYGGEELRKVNPNIVASQFNHVILAVPMEQDTLWMENTATYLPTGYLGTFTQGRKTLVVNDQHSKLVDTPSLEINDVRNESSYLIDITDLNDVKVKFDQTFRGRDFENLSYYIREGKSNWINEFLVNGLAFSSSELISKDIQYNRDSLSVKVSGELKPPSLHKKVGNDILLSVPDLPLPRLESIEKRNSPVRIDIPIAEINSYTFKINEAYEVRNNIDFEIKTEFGLYRIKSSQQDMHLNIVEEFELRRTNIDKHNYHLFYNFFKEIEALMSKNVIVLSY